MTTSSTNPTSSDITLDQLATAEQVIGLEFTPE